MIRLNTGAEIPRIGFGTWQLADGAEAYGAAKKALETGYRLIDTAAIYMNEASIGKAIRESAVPREEIFVTTKLWKSDLGYERAFSAYQNSLDRLGLDYVDLYLIHWPSSIERLDAWRAMEEMYRGDQVKNIGVSNFTIRHLKELSGVAHLVPAVNQIEFHPNIYAHQRELLDYCHEQGIAVEAYSPLAAGAVINDEVLIRIGKTYGKSAAQVALRWCIQHGTIPIPKSSEQQRMKENLEVFDFELTPKDMSDIDRISGTSRVTADPATMK